MKLWFLPQSRMVWANEEALFIAKVNVTGDLEIPIPYAFSVQQLSNVRAK